MRKLQGWSSVALGGCALLLCGATGCLNPGDKTGVIQRALSTQINFNELQLPIPTAITNQYQPYGVVFSVNNGGLAQLANNGLAGQFPTASGENYLAVNSAASPAEPTTLTIRFVDPASGAQAVATDLSIYTVDTNMLPVPRVIARSFDLQGNLLQTYDVLLEVSKLNFLGSVARVEVYDHGGDGHVIDDIVGTIVMDQDSDGDGVNDSQDSCPGTPAGSSVDPHGCSGVQNVEKACPATQTWPNHGQYVSCVVHAANAAEKAGQITKDERKALVDAAAHSNVGK